MKKKIILFLIVTCQSVMIACNKEGTLSPSVEPENVYSGDYTLPQGEHSYDPTIQELFDKFQTMFLYKYVPADLYYSVTRYMGGSYDPETNVTSMGYFDVPADEDYVGYQLDLLKEIWLDFYSDEFLKSFLPIKVFLVDSFYYTSGGVGKPQETYLTMHDCFKGSDNLIVSYGGKRVLDITPMEKFNLKGGINSFFLYSASNDGVLEISKEFSEITDYSEGFFWDPYPFGVLAIYDEATSGFYTVQTDWRLYLEAIVSNTYETLTSPGGILHEDIDVNGLIRLKYDIIIKYFIDKYNVNLQEIGNTQY